MFSSGYLKETGAWKHWTAANSQIGPNLPTNINMQRTSLLASESPDVRLIESPTVQKAETTSKKISKNGFECSCGDAPCSRSRIRKLAAKIICSPKASKSRAFCTVASPKARCLAIAWFLPLKFASKNAARILNVVVLIPPAHEPGDPPMNMRNMTSKSAALLRLAWLIVAKPAVRQVTDSKNALQILSPREKEAKPGLRQPSRKSIAAPPSTSQQVTPRTSLL